MFQHLKAVWTFRHFWMSLVRMDLRQKYRRSVLGIGWSLLHPLAMAAVFCVVFSGLMKVGENTWQEYACYLIAGMTVWDFVRNSTLIGCSAFLRNESYIRQCPLPCGIYPLRTVMGTAIHFLIGLGVIVTSVAVLKPDVGLTGVTGVLPAVFPAVILLTLFCWAMATLSSFATTYFHDTQHLTEVGAQLFFFLTPIMYPRRVLDAKGIGWLADLNPVNLFLELIRTPLVSGEPPAMELYTQAVVLTVVAVGLACGTIGWLQKKLIFQL